jgi:hypothetical protein
MDTALAGVATVIRASHTVITIHRIIGAALSRVAACDRTGIAIFTADAWSSTTYDGITVVGRAGVIILAKDRCVLTS